MPAVYRFKDRRSSVSLCAALLLTVVPFGCLATAAQEPDTSQSITLLLSPSSLNVFNFGPHSFKVLYPPGSRFSGVYMTVTAAQLSESAFKQRVMGTQFANSVCVAYSGESGNCIDYQVTCSNVAHEPITCPRGTTSHIGVQSSFDTMQSITNPGLLTTPIGTDSWQNILDEFFLMRIDPTAHGHTNGFSEFVVVSLGTTNQEGAGQLAFNSPLRRQDPRMFPAGVITIPVSFTLSSTAHFGQPVTDAIASISVLMVADATGHRTSTVVFTRPNAFTYTGGSYEFKLPAAAFPRGTYILTVYGDAFASQAVAFTIT